MEVYGNGATKKEIPISFGATCVLISDHGQVGTILSNSRQGTDERAVYESMLQSIDTSVFNYSKINRERDFLHEFGSGNIAIIEGQLCG